MSSNNQFNSALVFQPTAWEAFCPETVTLSVVREGDDGLVYWEVRSRSVQRRVLACGHTKRATYARMKCRKFVVALRSARKLEKALKAIKNVTKKAGEEASPARGRKQ